MDVERIESIWRCLRLNVYSDLLADTSPNIYFENVRSMILNLQLCSRAYDLVFSVPAEMIQSEMEPLHIFNAFHIRDSLDVLSIVFSDLNSFFNYLRRASTSSGNYETSFGSMVSKYNAYGNGLKLPE